MILVGIVSRNRVSILPQAIEGALSQLNVEKEIFVFDNNSDDDTRSLQKLYPSVNWIFSEKNNGYVWARNHLMRLDGFDFYMSLDDDSWFMENDGLAEAFKTMLSDKNIGAIAFDILSPDKSEKSSFRKLVEVGDFIGCGHLLRLQAAREAGFYQKMPGYYGGEEKDLSIKLIDLGYRIVKMQGVHVWHEKTNVARNIKAQHRSGVCNDLVFFYRRSPLLLLAPGLIIRIVKHLKFGFTHNLGPEGVKGINDFLYLMITMKIDRMPVKLSSLSKFRNLPTA